jgi:UDP-glucose 4-epimerase
MRLCVTGGAGYIGSVVVEKLLQGGHEITVLDNLSTGHRRAVPGECRLVEGDIRDRAALDEALGSSTDAVLHFAALSIVGDSMVDPLTYFDNNVTGSISLLRAMESYGILRFVFSSSAAIYGAPKRLPIVETDPCEPTNPYGTTKLMIEKALEASHQAWGLAYVALRYFNAGGSTMRFGEDHRPETHLIPIVLDTALGKRDQFTIFGNDYDTEDGTCIRDYIHVLDLADAHVMALDAMERGFSGPLNLGSETPFTVLQVVKTTERVTGRKIPFEIGSRRSGDPPALLASSKKAEEVLGWRKRCSSLEEIIRSAHKWRVSNPNGYEAST